MKPDVIFEDSSLIVLDKPAGWVVNEAKTTGKSDVVQTWMKSNFNYKIVKSSQFRSGIVHRIDKNTSGLLLVAKDGDAFKYLQSQFKLRRIKKEYLALVHGTPSVEDGMIDVPVARQKQNRQRFGVVPGGKKATTYYKTTGNYIDQSGDGYTLLLLKPITGRTHQIRVHLKYLGNPIVSDNLYLGKKRLKKDLVWCKRMFLHAYSIEFTHPASKKVQKLSTPLSRDLEEALARLTKS